MRQLLVQVERNRGREVLHAAEDYEAVHVLRFEALGGKDAIDAVVLHVENDQVEPLLGRLQELPGFAVSLLPHEVQVLAPSDASLERQTQEARHRSPIEVYTRGLRSAGSWTSFMSYAAVAGALSWTGLFTSTVFLLVAAMLVAPFPSPAMNAAVATARGDGRLLGSSLLRYTAALVVGMLVAALLSVLFRQQMATELMQSISFVSQTSLILPLVAGVAGGLHASNSEESSLISAAGAGMLVAAALSPPVGVVGMAGVLGEWAMAKRALFLLLLQIAGINLTGAIVFRLYGMSPHGVWYSQGSRTAKRVTYVATAVAFAALLFWQFGTQPELLRPSQAQDAAAVIRQALQGSSPVRLVDVDVHFARTDGDGVLVSTVSLWPTAEVDQDALKQDVRQRIEQALRQHGVDVPMLVDVTVLTELQPSRGP